MVHEGRRDGRARTWGGRNTQELREHSRDDPDFSFTSPSLPVRRVEEANGVSGNTLLGNCALV